VRGVLVLSPRLEGGGEGGREGGREGGKAGRIGNDKSQVHIFSPNRVGPHRHLSLLLSLPPSLPPSPPFPHLVHPCPSHHKEGGRLPFLPPFLPPSLHQRLQVQGVGKHRVVQSGATKGGREGGREEGKEGGREVSSSKNWIVQVGATRGGREGGRGGGKEGGRVKTIKFIPPP